MSRFMLVSCAVVALALQNGCAAEDDAVIDVGVGTISQALAAEQAPEQATESTAGAGEGASGSAASASRRLRIHVKEIRVHIAGDDGDGEGSRGASAGHAPSAGQDRAEGPGWTTVFSGRRTIDLSETTALASVLGSANARPGRLTQVRLILDGPAELVENGQSSPVACPSCEVSGLKVINPGGGRLEGGKRHGLLLAVDVNASLVDEGGALRLRPVIRVDRRR